MSRNQGAIGVGARIRGVKAAIVPPRIFTGKSAIVADPIARTFRAIQAAIQTGK